MQPDDKIEVVCACGEAYRVEASRAGKKVRCRACGKAMLVPSLAGDETEDAGGFVMDGEEDELAELASAFDDPAGSGDADSRRRRRRHEPMSWLDRQFADTSTVLIILIALLGCFACVIWPLSLAGLIGCTHPVARRNAAILFIAHTLWAIVGVVSNMSKLPQ